MIRFSNPHLIGMIPYFLSESDPRPAAEQFNENYANGGGWHPFKGFDLNIGGHQASLHYPGDRPMREISRATLRSELIIVFEYAWVCIIQPDGTYEISRMD